MPFDPSVETPLPLEQVPKISWLPRRRHGRKIDKSTLFRWVQHGLRGVRLEALRVGGTLCTSEAALKRFFARLSAADPLCSADSPPRPRRSSIGSSKARRQRKGGRP